MAEVSVTPSERPEKALSADLSDEIVRTVDKRPADRVTCRRIYGNNYRCNWWSAADKAAYDNPGMTGMTVTTHRVIKSRFLNVTMGASGLVIVEKG